MKRSFAILLSLLMILALVACTGTKTSEPAKAAAEVTAEPTAAPTPEPTAVPTPEPTATPEPTEVPADVAIANASEKLAQVQSLHGDMRLNMDIEFAITMGESSQSMPMDVNMLFGMDMSKDPELAKMDLSITAIGQDIKGVIYVGREGENVVVYSSDDDGATWKKQVNSQDQLPQSPKQALDLVTGSGTAQFERTGTEEVNGKIATVYTGKVDGKLLQDILNSTGAGGELTESLGADMSSEELLTKLGDIIVTVMIDEESGLPVRFVMDMTEAMKELMMSSILNSVGADSVESLNAMGITIDVSTVALDYTLSQFNSIEPIVIPEEALNAPEA